ncbi:MAG: AlpA family transcriptional regulator [Planctomycetes bacterium]|nr:AlpA family transcriptional regulator [Planctomycetota bacterium]
MEDQTEYVSPREIAEQLCVTAETLLAWADKGKFPKPIKLAPKTQRWKRSDVENFLNQKQIDTKLAK